MSMRIRAAVLWLFFAPVLCPAALSQNSPPAPGTTQKSSARGPLALGSVDNGVYRNSLLGFTCKIPAGWVLRTEELNGAEDEAAHTDAERATGAGQPASSKASGSQRVLLAAFSRPPLAHGEDVNASILIAAESTAAYPGLKEAAQYFGPLTEVAKAQGFEVDEDPYEFAAGSKALVRGDFEKDVGSRVMHQSTLVMLARGYAVSFTFIGGTEDEVEELMGNLTFPPSAAKH